MAGGTRVQLRGDGLWGVPHLQCRFGTLAVEARAAPTPILILTLALALALALAQP